MLPKNARLTASEDFALTTKSGSRLTTENLVGYLYLQPVEKNSKSISARSGLIVNKSVGGSVKRHRIARQIRHDIAPLLALLPSNSLLVIRVLRQAPTFSTEINKVITGLISRTSQTKVRL